VDFDSYVQGLRREERAQPLAAVDDLVVVPSVDSTNRLGRRLADEFEREAEAVPALAILALEQTGGRGRRGRRWASARGKGVYATLVVAAGAAADLQRLPLAAAIGLCQALIERTGEPFRLKWPNDLVIETGAGKKKIGGILIESWPRSEGRAVALVGFGVNVGQGADELPEGGTSLSLLGHVALTLPALAWSLLAGLAREVERGFAEAEGALAARYRALSAHRPGDALSCQVGEGRVDGVFVGFDDAGRLRLKVSEGAAGERLVAAGEVIER
jgi:BirA family biotin operon repressor/biotin-[acetyl-CoA-carboxylase] ligase